MCDMEDDSEVSWTSRSKVLCDLKRTVAGSLAGQAVSVLDQDVYVRPSIGRTMGPEMVVILIHARGETIYRREGSGLKRCDR